MSVLLWIVPSSQSDCIKSQQSLGNIRNLIHIFRHTIRKSGIGKGAV